MRYPKLCCVISIRGVLTSLMLLFAVATLSACTLTQLTEEEADAIWRESAHADQTSASFTHWDGEDPAEIPVACAKCHSTPGYLDYYGADGTAVGIVDHPAPIGTTIECAACHNEVTQLNDAVTLPSGQDLTELGSNANCYACHQGRAYGGAVEAAITGLELDRIDQNLRFINIHANAAGAVLQGTNGDAGYEYSGRSYVGRFEHVAGFNDCTSCHDPHSLRMTPLRCGACHADVRSTAHLQRVRTSNIDFDGDGKTTEGIAEEIDTLHDKLMDAMQAYVTAKGNMGALVYVNEYRYFVNGRDEVFVSWTPRLLRAAYNYQLVAKDRGSFAHNPNYVIQLLYDSIEDLGGSIAGMNRPAVP
ncbi:MAG: hypothetical protein KDE20_16000 [Caldilineaceae bacterium]|nr:hypothetical protein [Caldilineaceae bacterium]